MTIILKGKSCRPSFYSAIRSDDNREWWRIRTLALSRNLGRGYLHLFGVALSILGFLMASHREKSLKYPTHRNSLSHPTARPENVSGLVPPLWLTLLQSCISAAVLILSTLDAIEQGSWIVPWSWAYLFLLGIARLAARKHNSRRSAYRHFVVLSVSFTTLDLVKSFIPFIIIDGRTKIAAIQVYQLISATVFVVIVLSSPRTPRDKELSLETLAYTEATSPEETCSWVSYYASYSWLTSLILKGVNKDLSLEDLPALPWYDAPLLLLQRTQRMNIARWRTFPVFCTMFRKEIVCIIIWATLTAVAEYGAPMGMLHLLRTLEDPETNTAFMHPTACILLLCAGPLLRSLCYQQSIFRGTRMLVLWRAVIIQKIFNSIVFTHHHTETLPETATRSATNALMDYSPLTSTVAESLISYDAEMVSHSTDMFYAFTASLTSTVLAMTILYHLLGWPSLFGIMVLAALTPMPAIISKRVSRLHREVMHATDARIAKISECLQGIRTLKYFAWEPMMFAKVDSIRLSEQQRIWKRNITSMFVPLVGDMMSLLSLTVVFTALLLVTNRPLRAPVAFTSLSIMETLRGQYVWLSKVVQCVAQARESAQRLDLFLESGTEKQRGAPGPPAFANATFRMPGSSGFKLSNITIYFEEKALNVVTGAMGSGKTMLLLSLLGETTRDSGQVTCPVDVAFVPQTAWLQSGSIRQNIVFYSHYEETRYNEVLHACDLVNDLTLLPDGDRTAVGEKGSNLSGGQKQRISLARAVYSTASTLLLDDVFSALDAQTTAKVYKRCFRSGILGDRTVILATQLRQAIDDAQLVIYLHQGVISSASGPSVESPGSCERPMSEWNGADRKGDDYRRSFQNVDLSCSAEIRCSMDSNLLERRSNGLKIEEPRSSGRVPRYMSTLRNCRRTMDDTPDPHSSQIYDLVWKCPTCAFGRVQRAGSSDCIFLHSILAVPMDRISNGG